MNGIYQDSRRAAVIPLLFGVLALLALIQGWLLCIFVVLVRISGILERMAAK